jgi:hypothetical protein
LVTIPGKIVGKNQARRIDRKRGASYITREMKLWMRSVAVAAWAEAVRVGWPNAFAVKEAAMFIQRFNQGGDSDRGSEFLADALQYTRWPTPRGLSKLPGPIGIVGDDKFIWNAGSPPSIEDDAGPRIELVIELRAIHPPHVADDFRARWYKNEARRALRKKAKLDSKEFNTKKVVASAVARRSRDELARIEDNLGIRLPL